MDLHEDQTAQVNPPTPMEPESHPEAVPQVPAEPQPQHHFEAQDVVHAEAVPSVPAPEPVSEVVTPIPSTAPAAGDAEPETEPSGPQDYTWEASEFIYHEKPVWWYGALWGIAAIICGILGLLQQWTSIAVVVVGTLALLIYSRKPPETLKYSLDEHGITIGDMPNPYTSYKSYSVVEEVGWHEVDMEASKRFVPKLTLICESDDIETIDAILSQHLPRIDHNPDWIDRASRYLRF